MDVSVVPLLPAMAATSAPEERGGADAFVPSVDAAFGRDVPAEACPWFSDRPPLVLGARNDARSLKSLKQKARLGLPAHLRCAVWTAAVRRVVHPHLPVPEADAAGTAARAPRIDAAWERARAAAFPHAPDAEDDAAARPPDLGLGTAALDRLLTRDYGEWRRPPGTDADGAGGDDEAQALPPAGARALARVLCAVQRVLGIEFCPPLPDVGESRRPLFPIWIDLLMVC